MEKKESKRRVKKYVFQDSRRKESSMDKRKGEGIRFATFTRATRGLIGRARSDDEERTRVWDREERWKERERIVSK